MLNKIYSNIKQYIKSEYSFSLADKIGLCILFANKYKNNGKTDDYRIVEKFLNSIIETDNYLHSDLIAGSSGVLWLLKYLKRINFLDFSLDDVRMLENVSMEKFKSALSINNWNYHYNGALGHLLAIQNPQYDELFLRFIDDIIKKDNNGNYSLLSINYPESTNLGLHAGIMSILALTNKLMNNFLLKELSIKVQDKILDIIFSKLEETKYKYFPALYNREYPCRMCWTYGELILSVQLLGIGIKRNDNRIILEAIKIAELSTLRNSAEKAGINDSCLFIGAAGNYLLYNILNKYSPMSIFSKSELLWKNYTHNILEYNNYHTINRYSHKIKTDLSISEGLCGICLVLDDFDDLWHEYILLNIFNLQQLS
jgi:hypothetical protein